MTDPVRSIMAYQPNRENLGSYRLFASTDNNIYNITASTNAPAVSLALTGAADNGRWTSTMMTNTAGAFLIACTHIGGYKYYDGATWNTPTFGGGAGQISGLDPANMVFVTTWKHRTWVIEKDSTNAWYSALDSVTGAFTKFELGPFVKHGGKLAFIATWTIDAGEGIDDFIVFAFENGDVLIYKGTDPTSASTFALQGAWYIGAIPVGRRCFSSLGGDLLILSEMGLQPLSYVTRGGQSLLRAASTDYLGKIQPRIADLVSQFGDASGWELTLYPRENLFMVSKPTGGVDAYEQYALYTNTNTWTLFQNIPSICFCIANSDLYFGTEDGRVCLAFNGFFDEVLYGATTGNGIAGLIQPSYSYFGMLGKNKQFLMARPTFLATDQPSVICDMLADYRYQAPSGSVPYVAPSESLWDTAVWDTDTWGGQLNVYDDWLSVQALGYTGSAFINTVCVGDTFLASIDYMFEPGGPM
jgi:hypothetical protein